MSEYPTCSRIGCIMPSDVKMTFMVNNALRRIEHVCWNHVAGEIMTVDKGEIVMVEVLW